MATSTSRLSELAGAARGRRLLGAVLAAAILATVLIVASRSSLLRVRHLELTGASHLAPGDVVRLSGISGTTNVLWFDRSGIERRLEANPWIGRAIVSRALPWTIRIAVVERRPVAVVREGEGPVLVAGDGTVLGAAEANNRLPAIVLPPGSSPEGAGPVYGGAARAVAVLDATVRPRILRTVVTADGTLRMMLAGGVRISYGSPTRLEAKAEAVRRILRWAKAEGASLATVNVSSPDAPAATLA
ncbi:MAG: cell division protein FtsQ/DivIB [Actinomycetota bacterium]